MFFEQDLQTVFAMDLRFSGGDPAPESPCTFVEHPHTVNVSRKFIAQRPRKPHALIAHAIALLKKQTKNKKETQ
jgi:hypothetical protein